MVTRYLRQAVAFTAIFSLLVTDLAWAAGPIADPTAPIGFRPTVQNAPNGVPTVNITQPSAGGVSRNRYDSFNVTSQGVILNNSTAAGVSVLAGSLAANPNLTLSAQVILNEVTGGGLSSLAGPTEVFGPAASVIIANPNGISVSGASFINAPRVSLITGTPSADGRVFTIDSGLLAVTGSGLDGTGISQLDLVGRRVSLDSGVTGAGTLTVIGGAVEYDHVSGQATALASPSAQGGSWAIDASALGAMNAGQVHLIGSEAGVGVRALGGMAASAGGITVTSSGQIVLGGTVGATDAVTVSAGSDANLNSRTTAASLTASAGGNLVHSGTSTLTGGASLSGGTVTASGGIIAGGDVAINSTGETSLTGTVASDGSARVTTNSLSLTSGGALTAGGAIEATATDAITNAGAIDSGAGLRIAAASLSNSGRVGASGTVEVTTAGGLDNSGGQVRGSDITLRSGGSLTNVSGTVGGTGQLTVTAAAIDNRQGFLRTSGGNVTVSTTGRFDNSRGVISGRDLALDAASLDNSGGEAIASGLLRATTNTGAMVNQGGTLFAHGTATLTSAGGIANTAQGLIGAEGVLALTAVGAIDNSGGTIVGNDQVALTSAGQLVQGGSLTAAAALSAIAASFINRGYTASADTVTVTAGTVSAESGQITANRDVTVTATGTLDNRARISSGTDVRLSAATLSNGTTGRVEANNAATLSATGTLGNSGLVAANGAVSASAGGALFNSKGTLLAGSTMTLTAGTALTNEAGLIQSGGDLTLTAGTRIDNRRSPYTSIGTGNGGYREQETSDAASISAGGNLRLTAPIVVNQASLLAAGGDLTVTATSFSNQVNSLTTLTRVGHQVCKKGGWFSSKKCWTDYSNSWSYAQTPSLVYAGGTFGVGAASVVNTGTIQAHKVNAVANAMTNGLVDWTVKTMPAATPASRIDLTQYSSLPTGTAGLFDISRDPASRYVVTTSVNVANQVNQDYLLTQLGSVADPNPRFFADPFAEAEMLKRAALAQTGQRFFVPEVKTDDEQRRALYDNAAAYAASRTDLHLGAALTDTQIAALAKPILWYVKNDDGVLTPTIYLPKVAQEQLTHLEGGRILADDATLKVAGQLHNTGYVTVANALTVDAGSILNEQRTARDTAAYVVTSKGKGSLHEVTRNVLQTGGEISAGTVRLTATDAITSSGGRINATSTLEMLAGGDITVAAARVENHERVNAGKAGWTLDSVVNHAALVAAGLDLTVTAGGDITVAGSKLQGGKDVALRAGGDVTLAAAVDEYSSHSWNKKSRSSSEFTREETTNRGAEVSSSGGDVTVVAHDTVTVQASRVAAADDVTLTAETGQVALLSGTDSRFVHEKSKREGTVWQTSRDRGDSSTSVKMTELEAGDSLSINAAKGVVADYRANGGLQSSLNELAKNPATAWVAQIAKRDDVTWQAVQEAHQSWNYSSQGLSGPAAAVIAIAVAVATQGAGAALLQAGFGAIYGAAAGAAAASGVGGAMASAAFTALVSQASISVINNRGNIGKVLQELGTVETAKNLAIAMASAGLTKGFAGEFNVNGGATASFGERLAYQGISTASTTAANTVIGGADLGKALQSGGLSLASTMATQVLARGIGDISADFKVEEGDIRKIIAHALVGCAAGQITQNCVAGAIGAGLQEAAGGALKELSTRPERQAQLAGLSAAVATLLVGGDSNAVNTANAIAQDAATYNRNLHASEKELNKRLALKLSEQSGLTQIQEREIVDQITCVLVQCDSGINALDPNSQAYADSIAKLWTLYPREMPAITAAMLTLIDDSGKSPYAYTERDAVVDRDIGIHSAYPEDIIFGLMGLTIAAKAGIRLTLSASAPAIEIESLRFTQTTASPVFSENGLFAGKSIGQVADEIRSGVLNPKEIPVEVVRSGDLLLVVNTRSSIALRRAGVSPQEWSMVDRTNNTEIVREISERLSRNKLDINGTDVIRITGGGRGVSVIK